ncbi:beta-galactosidase/beta-glucuronidase [Agrococcus sp. UYP33]
MMGRMTTDALPRATAQTGTHPRPQLLRSAWTDLSGPWGFEHDDDDAGVREGWARPGRTAARTIVVPFPPESDASGIGERDHHPVVWYRRTVTVDEVRAAGWQPGMRLLVHFGAVDYRATVWADGAMLGEHEGGHTPFAVDATDAAREERPFELVVRAEDDPLDLEQPRGKQDWLPEPHVIWYDRTTGIWQPVWLEAVPETSIDRLGWSSDLPAARVSLELGLSRRPAAGTSVRVRIADEDGEELAAVTQRVQSPRARIDLPVHALQNGQGYESMLWSPEHPRLLDATVELLDASGAPIDAAASYLGLRSVSAAGGRFLLNDRPHPVIAVLEQGYWPESHLAAPSADALRAEVELIKALGFTTVRVHQKIEDPRFLFWADRLGLLVWEEMPSAYAFSATSVERLSREWQEAIERDRSHPCIVAWVPVNESWGVQHIAHDERQQQLVRALFHLTKALDDTRLVISNDGWEHGDSDLLTIHDYEQDRERLAASYRDAAAIERTAAGIGPAGRRIRVLPDAASPGLADAPVIVSEFGGVTWAPDAPIATWGYGVASSPEDFERRLRDVFGALHGGALAGLCYTQLTDTLQEANGLVDEHRRPKLPLEVLRAIVTDAPR